MASDPATHKPPSDLPHGTDLAGRVAVVTGGGSGIGLAALKHLERLGAVAVPADLRLPEGGEPTDVSRAADVQALFDRVQQAYGGADILVVAAGQGIHERLAEGDPEAWARVIDTNVMGALRAIRAFVPGMLARGAGEVVVISSVSAQRPHAWGGVYAASKAALEAIAEALRLEVQPTVRVTTIALGVVDTPFFERMIGGDQTPESLGWGALAPEEVAEAVAFAVTRPPGVAVNQLTLRPAAQPF